MKILVVTPTFMPIMGGIEIGSYNLFNRLSEYHAIKVLTPYQNENILKMTAVSKSYKHKTNYEVLYFKDTFSFLKLKGKRFTRGLIPPVSLSVIWHMRKEILIFKPDIVHVVSAIPYGLPALLFRKLYKIPILVSLVASHDIKTQDTPLLWQYYVKCIINRADMTTYVSKYCLDNLGKFADAQNRILPFGVDVGLYKRLSTGEIAQLRTTLAIGANDVVLVVNERLVSNKNVKTIIKAFELLIHSYENAKLIIIGDGPQKNILIKLVNEMNITKNVIFLGIIHNDDVPRYLGMCDIFVHHSLYETFGIALIEAMVAGKPVIACDNSGVRTIIADNVNGLLYETNNYDDLTEKIKLLIENLPIRQKLIKNALKKVNIEYNWNIIIKKYNDMLEYAKSIGP